MKSYYTSEEARKKLDLPKSTFYYLVKKGELKGIKLPLRSQAVYSRQEIDRIVEEKTRMLQELEATPDRFTFVVPNKKDLEQLLEMERESYHDATIIPVEVIQERLKFSPENIHVLKDNQANKVVGSITMSPVKPDVLQKLISLEIDETQVQVSDYLPFVAGDPQDCYIVSITVEKSVKETYIASHLIRATANFLVDLLDRGIVIQHFYTVATTEDGEKLAKSFGLTPLKTDWQGPYEEFRHSYVLDLETVKSTSKLIKLYQRKKKNLERRVKRYSHADDKK